MFGTTGFPSGIEELSSRLFFLAYSLIGFYIISQLVKHKKTNANFRKEIIFPIIMCLPGVLFSIIPSYLRAKLFLPVAASCVGTVLIIVAVMYAVQQNETKKRCNTHTIATVINNRKENVGQHSRSIARAGGACSYFPIISFSLPDGTTHKAEYDTGLITPRMTGPTEIVYNLSDPDEFYFSDHKWDKSERLSIFMFLSFGLLSITISAVVLVMMFL